MKQLSLLDQLGGTTAERYVAFHRANPLVMELLVDMAYKLRARGVQHYGIAALWEALRYDWTIRTSDPSSQLKLPNDYRAYYAREIMARHPDLDGFFTIRKSQADADR